MKTIVFSLLLTVVALPASAESPRIIITDWPGAYHADEVADVHDGEHWTGFVIEGDRWKAFDATVSVKTVKDVVVDRHNGRLTGKQVTSDPKALFLLKDVDIAARKGASYALPKDPLAIATSYTIKGEHDVMLLWQQGIFLDPETNKTAGGVSLPGGSGWQPREAGGAVAGSGIRPETYLVGRHQRRWVSRFRRRFFHP